MPDTRHWDKALNSEIDRVFSNRQTTSHSETPPQRRAPQRKAPREWTPQLKKPSTKKDGFVYIDDIDTDLRLYPSDFM